MFLELTSNSVHETIMIAITLTKILRKGDVLLLSGDLGAGKTHFVKGVAEGLGIKERIVSPTFTIMNVYESGAIPLYHLDMYRVENEDELFETGLLDYLDKDDAIIAVEWNKYKTFGEKRVFEIELKRTGDETRTIVVKLKDES
ncbi:MAG: tRNA (adenosine(37)-N6)-threonylcarbamoyltransferase complex ATPase subunit type 1 TsaE [Clostridiales bacterium]|nr:tRNA (adenosine(37)-N6)-threonylcarbamoyltransferase complex ATPase subunit type 1 TsaE [Clostridiales bacterium]